MMFSYQCRLVVVVAAAAAADLSFALLHLTIVNTISIRLINN